MTGTAIYTWHNGKSRYDVVRWDPTSLSREQAAAMAARMLREDRHATRIQVQYDELEFEEALREPVPLRIVRRSA